MDAGRASLKWRSPHATKKTGEEIGNACPLHFALLVDGVIVLIAGDLALAMLPGVAGAFVGIALWGVLMAVTQGLFAKLVAHRSPPELRGSAYGIFNLVSGVALVAASVIAGIVWDAEGPTTTFVVGAVFAGSGACRFAGVARRCRIVCAATTSESFQTSRMTGCGYVAFAPSSIWSLILNRARWKRSSATMSAIKNYVAAISAGLFVASCSQQPANQQNSKPKSVLTQDTYNLALFAAAEDFETLTESAFSADIPAREMLIDRAIKATDQVANFASPALTTRLQALLADIRAAQTDDAPADIAIASVEAFRELVSAVSGEQQIPVNVSLLDYAGFRFDAEAQAKPARFSDMQVTVRYAQAQWKGIESRKEIASLSPKFAASLTSMERAAQSGNIAKARAAAIVELDLVDELEKAFSTPPKG